jgi:hypothetical protein
MTTLLQRMYHEATRRGIPLETQTKLEELHMKRINRTILIEKLIDLSNAKNWDDAKDEWQVKSINWGMDYLPRECDYSIHGAYCMHNKVTGNLFITDIKGLEAVMGMKDRYVLKGIASILNDFLNAANPQTLNWACSKAIIEPEQLIDYRQGDFQSQEDIDARIRVNKRIRRSLLRFSLPLNG